MIVLSGKRLRDDLRATLQRAQVETTDAALRVLQEWLVHRLWHFGTEVDQSYHLGELGRLPLTDYAVFEPEDLLYCVRRLQNVEETRATKPGLASMICSLFWEHLAPPSDDDCASCSYSLMHWLHDASADVLVSTCDLCGACFLRDGTRWDPDDRLCLPTRATLERLMAENDANDAKE